MYSIRAIQFYLKGKEEFTIGGYSKHSASFQKSDTEVDLSGQHIVITGANSGIGLACAQQLASKGASVHMVCRDKQRGQQALKSIEESIALRKDQQLQLHLCDLSEMSQIRSLVDSLKGLKISIDSLIHNAGTMCNTRETTKDGLEFNFATNVAGVFLLTELLLSDLSANAKVILVSSGGMYTQCLEVKDLNMETQKKFDGQAQYAKNKRQQVVLCEKWAQLYSSLNQQGKKIGFYSMHPGWVDTPALVHSMPEFHKKFQGKLRTPDQGADTITWLVCRPIDQLSNAGFYFDRRSMDKHLSIALTSHKQADVDSLYAQLREITKV